MMLRRILFALCLPAVLAVSAGEAPPWRIPEADYRLSVRPELPSEATCVDLRRLVLPVLPDNGVNVFDNAGNPVAFQLHGNGMLAIAPTPGAERFDLYFGFKEARPTDTWKPESGPRPSPERLRLAFFWGGDRPCSPDEFLAWRNSDIQRRNRWAVRNFYERTGQILAQRNMGMFLIPWVPRFPQYWKNRQALFERLHTRNRGRWVAAATDLVGRPEIRKMQDFNNSWQWQMKNHFDTIRREQARIAKQYEQARNEKENGAENDLLGVVNWKNPRTFPATEVQLLLRPPETPEHYSALFTGFLEVPADGEYEFELQSNSLAILRLDGKTVLQRRFANGSQPPTREAAKVALKKGSVPFELFYRLNSGFGRMTVRMRPAGEGEFQLLAAENFTPARVGVPVGLSGRDNREYPLVSRRGHYVMYTGKRDFTPVEGFRFLTPPAETEWRIGDSGFRPATEFPPMVVLSRAPDKQLSFRFAGKPGTELPVLYSDYRADLVDLNADLSLRFWAPVAVYEDEELPVTVETMSRLPFAVRAELDIGLPGGVRERRSIDLAGKADERFHRAAADIYHKETVTLRPDALRNTETLEVGLSVGGFEFDRKQLAVARVSSGAGFEALAGKGQLALVLHRPKLSDIRNWELPRKIGEELLPGKELLLIGEAAVGAESLAAYRLDMKQQKLDFLPYDDTETPLESSLYRLLDRIGTSSADRAVLMLPVLRRMGALEPWMRDRYLAVLLERLKSNRQFRTVFLSPGTVYAGEEKEAAELLSSLRRLSREYGVQLLEPPEAAAARPPGPEWRTCTKEDYVKLLDRLEPKL